MDENTTNTPNNRIIWMKLQHLWMILCNVIHTWLPSLHTLDCHHFGFLEKRLVETHSNPMWKIESPPTKNKNDYFTMKHRQAILLIMSHP